MRGAVVPTPWCRRRGQNAGRKRGAEDGELARGGPSAAGSSGRHPVCRLSVRGCDCCAAAADLSLTLRQAEVLQYDRVDLEIGWDGEYVNPFDPQEVSVTVLVRTPYGIQLELPAFWAQPYQTRRIGLDRRAVLWRYPDGSPGWQARFAHRRGGPLLGGGPAARCQRHLPVAARRVHGRSIEFPGLGTGQPARSALPGVYRRAALLSDRPEPGVRWPRAANHAGARRVGAAAVVRPRSQLSACVDLLRGLGDGPGSAQERVGSVLVLETAFCAVARRTRRARGRAVGSRAPSVGYRCAVASSCLAPADALRCAFPRAHRRHSHSEAGPGRSAI